MMDVSFFIIIRIMKNQVVKTSSTVRQDSIMEEMFLDIYKNFEESRKF